MSFDEGDFRRHFKFCFYRSRFCREIPWPAAAAAAAAAAAEVNMHRLNAHNSDDDSNVELDGGNNILPLSQKQYSQPLLTDMFEQLTSKKRRRSKDVSPSSQPSPSDKRQKTERQKMAEASTVGEGFFHDSGESSIPRNRKDIRTMNETEKIDTLLLMVMEMRNQRIVTEELVDEKIDEKCNELRIDIEEKLEKLEKHIKSTATHVSQNIRIVIRNISETDNEKPLNKINRLFRDGLKLNVCAISAERKTSYKEGYPGLIIATLPSEEVKGKIMKAKQMLSSSKLYKDVFIEYDKSRQERNSEANLRAIVKAIGADHIHMKGGRVFANKQQNNGQHHPHPHPRPVRDEQQLNGGNGWNGKRQRAFKNRRGNQQHQGELHQQSKQQSEHQQDHQQRQYDIEQQDERQLEQCQDQRGNHKENQHGTRQGRLNRTRTHLPVRQNEQPFRHRGRDESPGTSDEFHGSQQAGTSGLSHNSPRYSSGSESPVRPARPNQPKPIPYTGKGKSGNTHNAKNKFYPG